jgi:signal transduction histidine kinase
MGLIPAIKWLSGEIKEQYGIDVDFESNGKLNKLNVETSVLLFKTINELLLNVVKHSKAKKAVVSLTSQGDNLQVKVEDNGIGFNTSEINNYIIDNNSLGIFKISEKIKYLGGTFDIKSKPGQGTVVTFITPIH